MRLVRTIFFLLIFFLSPVTFNLSPAFSEVLLIDDFEEGAVNKLGGNSNTYMKAPSRSLALRTEKEAYAGSKALMVKFDKKNQGGPYGNGGWCGYYTTLKTGPRYVDATDYASVSFWVKGQAGTENFVLGLADRHWDEVGDSVKSEPIVKYLESGKLSTEWQKATVPLKDFSLDRTELASVAVCFEGSVFPEGAGKGTVYLDDLQLE